MLDKLKADFDGILELVQKVPDPLKETALKIILDQWFAANAAPPQPPSPPPGPPLTAGGGGRYADGADVLGGQDKTGHLSTLQNRPFPVSGIEAD